MTEYRVVISDIQAPLDDRRAIDAVATFLADRGIEETWCVGDVADAWQISRWTRGTAGEHDGQLGKGRDRAVEALETLRVKHLSRSNHDDRIETITKKIAPGLRGLPELTIESFLRLGELGVNFYRHPVEIAPGWVLAHGDEGSLIASPGGTAMNLAKRWGVSVVCGHTHKIGVQHHHASVGGRIRRELWGFEVGHLMDQRKAGYLKAGHGNWTQGFGVLVIDGKDVTPLPVVIRRGRFTFDGQVYRG